MINKIISEVHMCFVSIFLCPLQSCNWFIIKSTRYKSTNIQSSVTFYWTLQEVKFSKLYLLFMLEFSTAIYIYILYILKVFCMLIESKCTLSSFSCDSPVTDYSVATWKDIPEWFPHCFVCSVCIDQNKQEMSKFHVAKYFFVNYLKNM